MLVIDKLSLNDNESKYISVKERCQNIKKWSEKREHNVPILENVFKFKRRSSILLTSFDRKNFLNLYLII